MWRKIEKNNKLFVTRLQVNDISNDIWFLDSGCSNHISCIRSIFKNINKTYKLKVGLGNNKQIQIEGRNN